MNRLFINDQSPHSPDSEYGVLRISGNNPANMVVTLDDVPVPCLREVNLTVEAGNFPSATLYIEPTRIEVDGPFEVLLNALKQT